MKIIAEMLLLFSFIKFIVFLRCYDIVNKNPDLYKKDTLVIATILSDIALGIICSLNIIL